MRTAIAALALLVTLLVGLSAWAEETATAPSDPTALAEDLWSYGFKLPERLAGAKDPKAKPETKADVLVWLPNEAKKVRALIVVPNNTDLKPMSQHRPLREVARKHETAIVYIRNYPTGIEHVTGEPDTTQMPELFKFLANELKLPELQYAPWITLGKSSRGEFPFHMAWLWPERTIATVVYHGETPTWPLAAWARPQDQTILHLNVNGEVEWGGTWYNHVRPSLLNYRANNKWLPHIAVSKGVGHGDYVDAHGSPGWGEVFPDKATCIHVWDYIALFVDKALTLRLPADKYPTNGPLTLTPVDETQGYLIDPFAVEELFGVPHLPLREKDGQYVVGGAEEFPVTGFAMFAPRKDFTPGEGAPVIKIESGKAPKEWLITDSMKAGLSKDPMIELGDLAQLMPKNGDTFTVDGQEFNFRPIAPKYVATEGGIQMNTGLRPQKPFGNVVSLFAYTVLDVPEKKTYRVSAGFTAATRVQLVLNGQPIRDRQIIELEPGKYPLLFVLRLGASWARVAPYLEEATPDQIALAQKMQADADAFAAEQARLKAAGLGKKIEVIRKYSDVPVEQRKKMFWVADKELADAWLKLHTFPQK
ncbi:MAG: hypothetical protein WCJ97_09355 [Phycisphaerae bacterium]